jgi:hypothetical protein
MSKASYLNNYVNNLNTNGDVVGGTQLNNVINDIHNLNMNANYQNFLSIKGKNDEILSKDSGVQSNGDIDSGMFLIFLKFN